MTNCAPTASRDCCRGAAPGDQNADDCNGKCGRWLAHVFLPIAAVPNRSAWRDSLISRHVKKWCSNAADAYVKLTVFLGNDERCFLITIDGSSTALSGSWIGAGGLQWAATRVSQIRRQRCNA